VYRKIFIKFLKKEDFLSKKCFKKRSFFVTISVDSVENENKQEEQILFSVLK